MIYYEKQCQNLEGQYIIKNVLIISTALVLGGDLNKKRLY